MDYRNLIWARLTDDCQLAIYIGPALLVLAVIAVLLLVWAKGHALNWSRWQTVEAEIALGGIGKIRVRPDGEVVALAHQAWAELITRKAGLMFDDDNDVIVEVYDSWYELFREFRRLAKEVPPQAVRRSTDAEHLVHLLVRALNDGLRPHLTRYQARFRRWYDVETKEHVEMDPQDIQKLYPGYEALVNDLKKVNSQMIQFAEALGRIAHGRPAA
jgi:hypothetical protein